MGKISVRAFAKSLSAMLLSLLSSAQPIFAQEAPMYVRWNFDDLMDVKRIEITVMVDQLTVTDVVVNKGNCRIATNFDGAYELSIHDMAKTLGEALTGKPAEELPRDHDPASDFPLKGAYGDVIKVYVPESCNVLRIEMETDQGQWTSQFTP
jgi:hypothetical protein